MFKCTIRCGRFVGSMYLLWWCVNGNCLWGVREAQDWPGAFAFSDELVGVLQMEYYAGHVVAVGIGPQYCAGFLFGEAAAGLLEEGR